MENSQIAGDEPEDDSATIDDEECMIAKGDQSNMNYGESNLSNDNPSTSYAGSSTPLPSSRPAPKKIVVSSLPETMSPITAPGTMVGVYNFLHVYVFLYCVCSVSVARFSVASWLHFCRHCTSIFYES